MTQETVVGLTERIGHARRKLARNPQNPTSHNQLGIMLATAGDFATAERVFQTAIMLCPTYGEAWLNRALVLEALGRLAEGRVAAYQACQLVPDYREAQEKFRAISRALGYPEEIVDPWAKKTRGWGLLHPIYAALEHLRRAVEKSQPSGPPGLDRESCLRQKLEESARDDQSLAQLIELFLERDRLTEAEHFARYALRLKADAFTVVITLARILERGGRINEALAELEARYRTPSIPSAFFPALLRLRQMTCTWNEYDSLLHSAREALTLDPSCCDPFTALSILPRAADHQRCANAFAVRLKANVQPALPTPRMTPRKITLGYMSADFHQHAVATLVAELFALHDRRQFDVFGYGLWLNDDSPVGQRIRSSFDRFTDLYGSSDTAVAEHMARDEVDILIDLTGYTLNGRPGVHARRPAPIQVNYLGYPGTLGAGLCDYIIGDATVIPPEHAPWYDEKIVRLPNAYQINDRQRPRPGPPGRRKDHGLADNCVVYCNFNSVAKITPETFRLWLNILKRAPNSLLWLLSGNAAVRQNLRNACEQDGVSGDRIVFADNLPYGEHIARYHHADIFLDTAGYNAHTTCSEALWLGCPVITCLGDTFPSRVAASLLRAAGLGELVTFSTEEYAALAVSLAEDVSRRRSIRERLRKEGSRLPLFDAPQQVRHLEAAYREMWSIYLAGEPPREIAVPT